MSSGLSARLRLGGLAALSLALLVAVSFGVWWALGSGSDAAGAKTPAADTARGTQDIGRAPSYQLTDQEGQPFSSTALAGKVQVVSYLFPYCTSFCPLITRTMAAAETLADRQGLSGKVSFVAFNVDPEDTGPPQMRAFLSEYGISPTDPAWHYLTGSPRQIRQVVRGGYHVYYRKISLAKEARNARHQKRMGTYQPQPTEQNALASKANVSYDVVHNDTVEIVAPSGRIVSLFSSANRLSPTRLLHAIQAAAAAG